MFTPPPVVLAAILGLKVLSWQSGVTITFPYAIAEETFERSFRMSIIDAGSLSNSSAVTFEHYGGQ